MAYIAWDGNSYEGEPPAGWYLASDQRWWSPGAGPGPAGPAVPIGPLAVAAPPMSGATHQAPAPQQAYASPAQVAAPGGYAAIDTRRLDAPPFHFDGGAGTYLGTAILATLITIFTLGLAFPFAYVLRLRWKANHTYIEGRRLMFTGTGMGLFGNWIKWLVLIIITFGIYSFWVQPRLTKWAVEHQAFDPRG